MAGHSDPEPTTTESTAPPKALLYQFWLLVGVLNLGLLATSVGVLVLVFWTRPWLGIGALSLGVGALVFGWLRYRRVRATLLDAA